MCVGLSKMTAMTQIHVSKMLAVILCSVLQVPQSQGMACEQSDNTSLARHVVLFEKPSLKSCSTMTKFHVKHEWLCRDARQRYKASNRNQILSETHFTSCWKWKLNFEDEFIIDKNGLL